MFWNHSRRREAALAAGLMVAFAACSRKDAGPGDTGVAMNDTGAASGMADTGMAVSPTSALSDANIVFILDHANMLDSAAGSIAAAKGTSSDVRDFGTRMMREHHSLRQQSQDLAKKLALTPAPPPNDSSQAQTDKTMSLLNGAAKGRDFDKAYIDSEVATHKTLLETVIAAMSAAQNAELKNLIQKAAPTIQAHLDMAKDIQGKLQ